MPLNKTKVDVSFDKGINTKVDEKLVKDNSLLELENMCFKQVGSLNKRNGTTKLGVKDNLGNTLINNKALIKYDKTLLQIANDNLYLYNSQGDTWYNKGGVGSLDVSNLDIVRNNAQQANSDMSIKGNIALYVWEDSRGGVRYSVFNLLDKTPILNDVLLHASGEKPKTINVGDNLYMFYVYNDKIYGTRINANTLTVSNTTELVSTKSTNNCYDVCKVNNNMVLTYVNTSTKQAVLYLKQDFSYGSPLNSLPSAIELTHTPTANVSILFHSDFIWLASVGTNIELTKITQAFFTVFTSTFDTSVSDINNLTMVANYASTTSITLYYDVLDATPTYSYIVSGSVSANGTVGSVSTFKKSVLLAGKAAYINSNEYVPVLFPSTEQATYFMLNQDGTIVAKWFSTTAGSRNSNNVLNETTISDSKLYVSSHKKGRLLSEQGSLFSLIGVSTIDIDLSLTKIPNNISVGRNLYIASSFINIFDGVNITEANFHLYPENITLTESTSGSITAGIYQYQVVYNWVAANGEIHTSAPSLPETIEVAGSTAKVVIRVPTLHLTGKSNITIDVYRTEPNLSIFYKVTSILTPSYNDTTVNYIDINDTTSNTDLISNQLLYTTGGVLENYGSVACNILTTFQNRIFLVSTEDRTKIYYSKQIDVANGIGFSELLTLTTNTDDGNIVGLSKMDDKLVVLKERGIYIITGEGYNNAGGGNNYNNPVSVYAADGCRDRDSVVETSNGIMFSSNSGIYLLDRGLNASYIGAGVDAYKSFNVVKATTVPYLNEIRFVLSSGEVLVFNNEFQQWGVYKYLGNTTSCVSIESNFYLLTSDGVVYKEVSNSYLDDNTGITQKLVTQWYSMSGLEGYQRLYRIGILGEFKSNHILKVKIAYNFQPFYSETIYINAGQIFDIDKFGYDSALFGGGNIYGGTENSVYSFQIVPKFQKCSSFRLLIEDVNPEGESFEITSLQITYGIKEGSNKLPSGKRF